MKMKANEIFSSRQAEKMATSICVSCFVYRSIPILNPLQEIVWGPARYISVSDGICLFLLLPLQESDRFQYFCHVLISV